MNRFSSVQIKFDKDYLNKLTGDPNSGVFKQNCKYHIALHPAQFNDFGQSIKDELGRKISRYDDIFQGIMLGYENIKLQSDLGVIGLDNLYVHIDIQADFFVFRPTTDMILKGVVTRTTKDHVGCLVYGTFNISLPKLDKDDENWLGHKAVVQSDVVFKIIHVDLNSRLPYIRGQIISVLNPKENGLFTHSKNNKKLNKKIQFGENDEVKNMATPKSRKKHKKENNSIEESIENLEIKEEIEEGDRTINNFVEFEDISETLDDSVPNLKKKRKRKQNNDEEVLEIIKIKEEIFYEEDISDRNKKSKKHKKKQKAEYDDQDEEILRKRERRKEKKKKREQDKLSLSLESLDIKSLFDDGSVNISASVSSSAMANNEDRGKKYRESNSMSHDVYLENVKLEEDSDLERIISDKKRKKGKKRLELLIGDFVHI